MSDMEARLDRVEKMIQHLVEGTASEVTVEGALDIQADYLALSHQLETIGAHWRELVLTPARTEAMLFAILPAINVLIERVLADPCDDCVKVPAAAVRALRAWGQTTVAQRVALTELFEWVEGQIGAADSVIPQAIRDNLAASLGGSDAVS